MPDDGGVLLVMTSVMSGILGLGDVRKLGPWRNCSAVLRDDDRSCRIDRCPDVQSDSTLVKGLIPASDSLQSGSHAEQMAVVEETSQQKKVWEIFLRICS